MRQRPWLLIGLLAFTAVGALYGGIGLMTTGLGIPDEWLQSTPFDSWVLPGVALLAIVAAPMTAALIAELRGQPAADRLSLTAGLLLIGWIVVQVVMIQRFNPLQPTMFLIGVAIAGLSWRRSATG
jgi:hypothetical protein